VIRKSVADSQCQVLSLFSALPGHHFMQTGDQHGQRNVSINLCANHDWITKSRHISQSLWILWSYFTKTSNNCTKTASESLVLQSVYW